jgi:hypothetical protein
VAVRIDPAAPPAWSRRGEMTVLVRAPAPAPAHVAAAANAGVTRMRTLAFGGPLRGTVTVIESSWPPSWGRWWPR